MASIFKRAATYLGLGPDDAYDGHPDVERPQGGPEHEPADGVNHTVTMVPRVASDEPLAEPQPVATAPAVPTSNSIRVLEGPERPKTGRVSGDVRTPMVLVPRSFDDAQLVADSFKEGVAVLVNLQNLELDTARRLVDFCSGLCYGHDGEMSKVASAVYLLARPDVHLSDEDRRRIRDQEYSA